MRFLLLLAAAIAWADDAFITQQEYAAQLYHNPRGIGCHLCHGEQGEGMVIARYKHNGVDKRFETAPITGLDQAGFDRALQREIKGMPHYFLTAKERKTLYTYLHPVKESNVRQ